MRLSSKKMSSDDEEYGYYEPSYYEEEDEASDVVVSEDERWIYESEEVEQTPDEFALLQEELRWQVKDGT